jgi:hypothetical protein
MPHDVVYAPCSNIMLLHHGCGCRYTGLTQVIQAFSEWLHNMAKQILIYFTYLCLALSGFSQAAEQELPELPNWQVLEYEEKAFWATAYSRLEVIPLPGDPLLWELKAESSVVNNSENLQESFDPVTGETRSRQRHSKGKEQRVKTYQYETDFILRERRNPGTDGKSAPEEWPLSYSGHINYPVKADDRVVTSTYMLILLAHRLQAQGPGQSLEVLVHTDLNFFRVRLTSGKGIPIDVDYEVTGQDSIRGKRDTMAVALHVSPEGTLAEDNDFSLLGLKPEIILFFDSKTGLPVQIRGEAPRIGATAINLKAVTMRDMPQ